LETGRTHQIRVHMKHIDHPLFGDDLYGIGYPDGIDRQALHAESLGFCHPRTGNWMEWTCELPEDMKILLANLQ
jgi:23S rRNA pseudouridine1911/1915/1917 synthase